jgi:hypothetical protein
MLYFGGPVMRDYVGRDSNLGWVNSEILNTQNTYSATVQAVYEATASEPLEVTTFPVSFTESG